VINLGSISYIDVALGALGTSLLFLLGWAAKHILDRTVLPRFIDWWSERSKRTAVRRAEKIVKEYDKDRMIVGDPRKFAVAVAARIGTTVTVAAFEVILSVTFTVVGVRYSEKIGVWVLIVLAPLTALVTLGFLVFDHARDLHRYLNLDKRRQRVIDRVRRLLAAGGLKGAEIDDWLRGALLMAPLPPSAGQSGTRVKHRDIDPVGPSAPIG
jgi:hypothetical protein